MKLLTKPEELLLLAICILKEEAYGLEILKYVSGKTGYNWSVGSIYVPLDRLGRMGYVTSFQGEATEARGGKRKRFYQITELGKEALLKSQRVQLEMWTEIPDLALKKKK